MVMIVVLGMALILGSATLLSAHRLVRTLETSFSRFDDERRSALWCSDDLTDLLSDTDADCLLPRFDHGAPGGAARARDLLCTLEQQAAKAEEVMCASL